MARKPTTGAGDATGRNRDELSREHAEEMRQRESEIAMASEVESERKDNEIVDLTASAPRSITKHPGQPNTSLAADGTLTVTLPDGRTYTIKTNDTAVTGGVGPESPGHVMGAVHDDEVVREIVDRTELLDPTGERGKFGVAGDDDDDDEAVEVSSQKVQSFGEVEDTGVQMADSGTTVIRLNVSLEEVTIGAGNSYTFEEGRKYKVPRHVAEHLEEKGLVYH